MKHFTKSRVFRTGIAIVLMMACFALPAMSQEARQKQEIHGKRRSDASEP